MCNLKSNKDLKEILEYKKKIQNITNELVEFVLFPSDIYLGFFYNANFKIGCQNVSVYQSGSHTGEILAHQLASLKISYCLLNHAEANDTIENVTKKIHNACKENLKVVLCLGEENENEDAYDIITKELDSIFSKLKKAEQEKIIIAYEPKWSIQSHMKEIKIINETIDNLKKYIHTKYDLTLPVLYGGGINTENVDKLIKSKKIDGFLIGSCANNPENILEILKKI